MRSCARLSSTRSYTKTVTTGAGCRLHPFPENPGDPIPIHIDELFLEYAEILVESVREKTRANDEHSFPAPAEVIAKEIFQVRGEHEPNEESSGS